MSRPLQVLAESEQIRREADNIGPRAELDYWKKRMTKFNFLLDQIKGQDVKAVLTILQTAKSKLIQVRFVETLSASLNFS
jgi:dynein heavy chain, axonemal